MDSRSSSQVSRADTLSLGAGGTHVAGAVDHGPVLNSVCDWVQRDDVRSIFSSQTKVLKHFERTNEMLVQFNKVSAARFVQHAAELRSHTTTLLDLKRDLETVFKRIRNVKKTLQMRHGEQFCPELNEDELDEQLDREFFDDQHSARTTSAGAASVHSFIPRNSTSSAQNETDHSTQKPSNKSLEKPRASVQQTSADVRSLTLTRAHTIDTSSKNEREQASSVNTESQPSN